MRLKGPVVKQVNNLRIRISDVHRYCVWSPDGRCLEDRFDFLDEAVAYCKEVTEYIKKRVE